MSTKCQAASEKARAYSKTTLEPRLRSSVLMCLSSRGAYCSPRARCNHNSPSVPDVKPLECGRRA